MTTGCQNLTLLGSSDGRNVTLKSSGDQTIKLWDAIALTPDEKVAQFLAREIVESHPTHEDAIDVVGRKKHWNDAMREAAVRYVRAANGR